MNSCIIQLKFLCCRSGCGSRGNSIWRGSEGFHKEREDKSVLFVLYIQTTWADIWCVLLPLSVCVTMFFCHQVQLLTSC